MNFENTSPFCSRLAVLGEGGRVPDRIVRDSPRTSDTKEPRAAAERRCVLEVHDQASEPFSGQTTIVGRAFFGGRNADRSLGFAEEFSSRDGSGDDDDGANFHGQKRKNDTHASTSDPDSRLYRKAAGREAKLCYMGHATMENRHGLAVAGRVTHANGTAERRASEIMLKARRKAAGRRITAVRTRRTIPPIMSPIFAPSA